MTVLWLIRHAATDENLRYQMIGVTDVSLGTTGTKQAKALSRRLKSVNFEAIYTSPLIRARETAQLIAAGNEYHPSIQLEDSLKELHLGKLEGMSSFEAYEQFQNLMDTALDPSTDDFAFPGGELRSHAAQRLQQALQKLVTRHPSREIGVITHGGILGCWLSFLHNVPLGEFRNYQPKHASITMVHAAFPDPQFKVVARNDTSHLNLFRT